MARLITTTWGRSILDGWLLRTADSDGYACMMYIRGMLDALDVPYMINERHSDYVDIRVDCSDTMYAIIMTKLDKYWSEG